jgi:hypothetical protein
MKSCELQVRMQVCTVKQSDNVNENQNRAVLFLLPRLAILDHERTPWQHRNTSKHLFRLGNTSSQEKKHCEPPNREPQGPNWAFWVCARLQDLQFFAGRKSTNLRTGFRNNHFTAGQIVPLGAKFTPTLTL